METLPLRIAKSLRKWLLSNFKPIAKRLQMAKSNDEAWGSPLPQLLCDESDLGKVELFNAFFLAEYVSDLAREWRGRFFFSPEVIRECNRLAITGIYECAGEYRNRPVTAGDFVGVRPRDIGHNMQALCEYVNSQINDPFHAATYILWRTNWIHPFYDGNGRVSRELSYLAILAGLGVEAGPAVTKLFCRRGLRAGSFHSTRSHVVS